VLYGGRSGEHEVSLASAAAVFANLDRTRYEPVPLRIEKDGRWSLADRQPTAVSAAEVIEQARLEAARPTRGGREVHMVARPSEETILSIDRGITARLDQGQAVVTGLNLDVIFPVLHGPYGEDGTIQGLLELAGVPYVGSGVLASAVAMDKAAMKLLLAAAGLSVGPYVVVTDREWRTDPAVAMERIRALSLPVFVKPARAGSSIGISKVKDWAELPAAVAVAREHDPKVVVEQGIDGREIECGVLDRVDGSGPEASVCGEIRVRGAHEFYDFEAKYLEASDLDVPAVLPAAVAERVRAMACQAFDALSCEGFARVDFFLRADGEVLVNEVNTIPGFTPVSMFPMLWAASGLAYPELVDRLLQLALHRRPGLLR
jgi:D-alanine-D-alanine ligase